MKIESRRKVGGALESQSTMVTISEGESSKDAGRSAVTETDTERTVCKEEENTGKEMESFLHENSSVVQVIGGLGSRKHVATLQNWYCRHYGNFLGPDDGMCASASIVHAVD